MAVLIKSIPAMKNVIYTTFSIFQKIKSTVIGWEKMYLRTLLSAAVLL
jgi:hypothetical protein